MPFKPNRFVLLLIALITSPAMYAGQDSQSLIIRNIQLLNPNQQGQAPVRDVLLKDGRIAAIEASIESLDGNIPEFDGTGRFLTPGLIDGHVHLYEVPGMRSDQEEKYPEVAAKARDQIPRSYLYHGFTTLVDLNSAAEPVAAWNAREIRPEVYWCGGAPTLNGYPMAWMPEDMKYWLQPYFIYDPEGDQEFPEHLDPADHTPEAVARRIKEAGAICIKTHHARGFGKRDGLPVPSREMLQRLITAAEAQNMPVLLHANNQESQAAGTEAGVHAFVHGMWTWNDGTATEAGSEIRSNVDAAIAAGVALQPTIQVLYGERDLHNPDYLADPRVQKVLPASLIDWYASDDGQWWKNSMLEIPYVKQTVESGNWQQLDAEGIARVNSATAWFVNKGGRLLFGSDTPSDPGFANTPGLNGRLEMDNLLQTGVTLRQLFVAATLENARFFGLEDEIGSIENGKRADLVILEQNPLESIEAWDSITHVIQQGRLLERAALAAD